MRSIYLLRVTTDSKYPLWSYYEYYAEEDKGVLIFTINGYTHRVNKEDCKGVWLRDPLPAFYFLNKADMLDLRYFLNIHAYLSPLIKKLPEISLANSPKELFPESAEEAMLDIVNLWTVLEDKNFPVCVSAQVLRNCILALGLDKTKFPALYTGSLAIRLADFEIIDKLAGVTSEMRSREKGAARRELIHRLLKEAEQKYALKG